jgi:putative ABC transport system permease protein
MKFWRQRKDEELDAEIRQHLDEAIRDRIARGETPDEARANAVREFGNVGLVKDVTREMWGWVALERLLQDLRFGVRMLRKQPGFTLIAILTVALGIGGNTAIFSVVNAVILKAVPWYEPQRLMMVTETHEGREWGYGVSAVNYLAWQAESQAFEHLIAFEGKRSGFDLTGQGAPERLYSRTITANVFPALGLRPQLGRVFTLEEARLGAAPVVLLSHALWQRRFGGDPSIIGRTLLLSGQSRTVIGVMPPVARGLLPLEQADVWTPLAINEQDKDNLRDRDFNVIGRLKPGYTVTQADAELNLIVRRTLQSNPDHWNTAASVTRLGDKLAGDLKHGLLTLFGAVGFVLLIACANVANLLLGRASVRQREMAIRAAVGAGRGRLVRQMLTESFLLSLLGGAVGLALAAWGVKALVAFAPDNLEQIKESNVDGTVLGFSFFATLLTGLVAGLISALQSSRIDLNEALKDGARKAAPRGLGRVSPALVVVEVALSLVVLSGAGLLITSYLRVLAVEPGFDAKNLLTMEVKIDETQYPENSPQCIAFQQQMLTRVKTIPGVKAAASTFVGLPMISAAGCKRLLEIEGRPLLPQNQRPQIDCSEVSADYFPVMGTPVRAGRGFTEQDTNQAPRVVIINETFARRYFPGEEALGQRLWKQTIVGIVADVKRFGLESEVLPEVYTPTTQSDHPASFNFLAVRTAGEPQAVVAAIRQQLNELGGNPQISDVKLMEERLAEAEAPRRFQMWLFGLFGAVALLLAAVGVYGVLAYSVSRRTHEIGIRMALGAQPRDVLQHVIRQGMTLALIGVVLGLAASLALTRSLASLLFQTTPTDPATFVAITLLLTGVALVACYLPARRATKVDPLIALRHE